jgi:hypothetical protein
MYCMACARTAEPRAPPFCRHIDIDMPVLSTEFREPHNFAQDTDGGGIHDDAVAKKVGMRGGTVAGSIHINQCAARSSQPRGHPSWHDAAVLVSGLTLLPLLPPQVRTALHPGVWCRGMVLKWLLERLLPQPNGAASPLLHSHHLSLRGLRPAPPRLLRRCTWSR